MEGRKGEQVKEGKGEGVAMVGRHFVIGWAYSTTIFFFLTFFTLTFLLPPHGPLGFGPR